MLGIVLKQFANLEEQHDEDGLGKLRLHSRQEADEQRTDSGDAHEQVLVERLALEDAFYGLGQHVIADEQIGHEKHQQLLPHGHLHAPCEPHGQH